MKKTINTKYIVMALAISLVFGVIGAIPTDAYAGYGYNGYYNDSNIYGTYIGNRYTYDHRPISNPVPVIIPQPIYVSQPVYIQQPVIVQQPVIIQQPVVYYPTINVSCSANTTYSSNGAVTWSAYVYGDNGYYGNNYYNNSYSYSWSGTDGLYGSGNSVYFNYNTSGTKYAYVTVYYNGRTFTQNCSNSVTVSLPYYNSYSVYGTTYQPVVYQQNYVTNNNLDIGCFVDPTNAKVDQPITWSAEVTGGIAPYIYSWSGSEGLSGSQSSVIKYYGTTGTKSAIVTVTSADGRTVTRACSNSLTVAKAYTPVKLATTVGTKTQPKIDPAVNTTLKSVSTDNQTVTNGNMNSNLSVAPLLSLSNVPWGWIAILIILVLFFTVLYLLFNRQKI